MIARAKWEDLSVDCVALERVSEFDYLGVHLQDSHRWPVQLRKSTLLLKQSAGSFIRCAYSAPSFPISPSFGIYRSQACGAALYGADIWGHCNLEMLETTENNFLKSLLKIPPSSPTLPICMDLNLRPISEIAAMRPIQYWLRVWPTRELEPYRECPQGFLEWPCMDRWAYIKSWLYKLGLGDFWSNPNEISGDAIGKVKMAYCAYVLGEKIRRTASGSLTVDFLLFKCGFEFEPYLDMVTNPFARALFIKLRVGTLPIALFTCRWKKGLGPSNIFAPWDVTPLSPLNMFYFFVWHIKSNGSIG